MIGEFQDIETEPSVFILSLKAGGVGITLKLITFSTLTVGGTLPSKIKRQTEPSASARKTMCL